MKKTTILFLVYSFFISFSHASLFDELVEAGPVDVCRTDVDSLEKLKEAVAHHHFVRQYGHDDTYHFTAGNISKRNLRRLGLINAIALGRFEGRDLSRQALRNGEINHELANDEDELITKLSNKILANATYYQNLGNGSHEVELSDGKVYGFNLCKPLIANPVYAFDTETRDFYQLRVITN